MTRFLPVADRALFLRYALPCAGTLVGRGRVSQGEVDRLVAAVGAGEAPEGAEDLFVVARAACSLRAIDQGKQAVDAAVIRCYFREGHDAVIARRSAEMGDFDPEACRVRVGTVEAVREQVARVRIDGRVREMRTDLFPQARPGMRVVTHWDFVVEDA